MTSEEFITRIALTGLTGRVVVAARAVLVDGEIAYRVAKSIDIDQGHLSRTLKRLRTMQVCSQCGQVIRGDLPG